MPVSSKRSVAQELLDLVFEKVQEIPDPRSSKGRSGKITLPDTIMYALAVFHLKHPSLLSSDDKRQQPTVQDNAKNLYHVEHIPCDSYVRAVIDQVPTEHFRSLFTSCFTYFQRRGWLKRYKYFKEGYLAPVDATQTFSSKKIHCKNCCIKNAEDPKKPTVYYHQLSAICLVKPGKKTVMPLMPEPITQQIDASKNDCEVRALERILADLSREHYHLKLIMNFDDLYSKGPTIKRVLSNGHHFIAVAKDSDHAALIEAVDDMDRQGKVHRFTYTDKKGHRHWFLYANDVPLNKSHPDLLVNFLDYMEFDPKGNRIYQNSWATSLTLYNHLYCMKVMRGGRAKWSIENETFNTLKNLGYSLEHNYGHGEENLSSNFACLMFLAFLIDQIVELSDPLFNEALQANKRKKRLWEAQRNFFEIFVIGSWLLFMKGLVLQGVPEPRRTGKRVKPKDQQIRKKVSIQSLFPDTS
ncbi:hypothetical protein [Salinisphaera sp. G21_0]|uniref:hypothetical protein n=1 Tax=Salinisphaera sp. G21_0 TaxID=2821094 RepID=UPI001ADAD332|nr:hypothetical protein [Salinisphaera sp. G21_0]MBO9483241.1 hypothetical protein [Salinisphaera sp. G21_0]